jgi:hypothetical protein
LLLQTTIDLLEVFSPAADDVVLDLSPQKKHDSWQEKFLPELVVCIEILTTFAPL